MKKILEKKKLFKKLYKDKTLKQIGEKYKLSSERVRQIITEDPQKLQKEYRQIILSYKKVLENISTLKQAQSEIRRLSRQDRRKKVVLQRRLLVRFLFKKFDLNKLALARMFKRDHTTIINLLN